MTLVSTVGGASGPLYGTFFLRTGASLGDAAPVPAAALAKALRAGLEGVVARGKAEAGDKTMYDALAPALAALDAALDGGADLGEAFAQARIAAEAGRDATVAMLARKGRASYLGERSVGHQDPGATSAALHHRRRGARCSDMGREAAPPGVGIVVVSHSRPLARAAVALAAEMVHGRPFRVAVAAGLDETTFGTDATRIRSAIEEVDGPDGVLVLMDLGSAVLSAELALELLDDPAIRDRVVLCPAPLVEGLVVAAVAAAGGAAVDEVAAEARSALMGKAAHLSAGSAVEPDARTAEPAATPAVVGVFAVSNEHGLHARPAARLVSEVRGLDAVVTVRNLTTGGSAGTGCQPEPGRHSGGRAGTRARDHGRRARRPMKRSSTCSPSRSGGSTSRSRSR